MIKASDNLEELNVILGFETEAEEAIIYGYIGIRLKPIIGKHNITTEHFDNICEYIAQNYFDRSVSIDYSINAVYNYINENKKCPPDYLFTDRLEEFLEDYAEEYDDDEEWKENRIS